MAAPVTKIYSLQTLGFDVVDKQLKSIAVDFDKIKQAKRDAEKEFNNSSKGSDDIKKFREEVGKLKVAEQELRVQRQQMLNEQKAQTIARQEEIRQQRQKIDANKTEEGSIARLRQSIKELNSLVIQRSPTSGTTIDFRGQLLTYDQAIKKLKELTAAEQEFRRQFAKDATLVGEYTTGIVNAFKQMGLDDLIAGQVTRTQDKLNSLNAEFNELQKELRETQAAGLATNSIEKQMIENRNEVIKLDTSLHQLRTDLRGVGDVGNQINASLNKGFSAVKGQLSSLLVQYLGVQAAISAAQSGIQDAKLSSDQFTELEIQLNNDAKAADNLNESLKELDTRTTLTGLQAIADVALKAGVTSENIAAVTAAIDKTKVAFGKDFGSVEQGTETFAKLINIFFDDGQITGERILKIGNSIRSLANETVASVPFLTDFSGRLAGLKQISNITLPDILGLGAGFEEFKQSAEVSSTVLLKVIPKLAADTEKFAQVAGLTNEEFTELINNNPAEALIRVSESLVKSGKDITDVSNALADSELGSGRITTIIGTLGGKADVFRERIRRAGQTIQETGAITDAFAKKNDNLAGAIDKSSKKVSDFFASKAFQTALLGVFGVITLIIDALPVLIGLLGLLTVNWLAQNAALLGLRLQLILYNAAIGANIIALNILRIANLAYIAVMFLVNGAVAAVNRTLAFFNITLKASSGPLGVILALAGLLATAFAAFGRTLDKSTKDLSEFIRLQRINAEINREASRAISDQVSKIDGWIAVIKAATTSADTKMKAMQELIKIDKAFSDVVKDNIIDLHALDLAYKQVIGSIKAKARAEASATLTAQKQQKIQEISLLRQDLEIQAARATGETVFTVELTDQQRAILKASNLVETGAIVSISKNSAQIFGSRFDQIKKVLDQKELEAIGIYQDYLKAQAQAQEDLNKIENEIAGEQEKTALAVSSRFEVDIQFLKDQIDKLNKAINEFKGAKVDLQKLIADRDKLQAQLDKLLGKQSSQTTRGSKLTGEQKDALKDIDALRDEELARLNESFIRKAEFQRRETNLLRESQDGRLEIARGHQSVLINDEEKFLLEQLEINTNAINKKLALLKGSNAEERKQIAQLNLEKIQIEQETNNKIFELRARLLKENLETEVKNTVEIVTKVKDDPTISQTDKAQAQLDADKKILDLTIEFNRQMDELEKGRNDVSRKNAEDRERDLRNIEFRIQQDKKTLLESQIVDITSSGKKQIDQYQINYLKLRTAILNNDKLTASQRAKALKKLSLLHNVTILSAELAKLQIEFAQIEKAYNEGLKSEEDFLAKKAELEEKQSDLDDAQREGRENKILPPGPTDLQGVFSEQLSKVFKFEDGSEQARLVGEVVAQSFDLATQAMNSYFDAEQQRIQDSLELNLQRIEIEKQQVLAKAQSQAEIDSIDKQYAAKKKQAQQKAGEELKKTKRSEAKIALLMELANIWSTVFQLGPIAGAIAGALLTALAIGRYSMTIKEINAQKFEKGGQPGKKKGLLSRTMNRVSKAVDPTYGLNDVPTKGGKFKGKAHRDGGTPFHFKGRQYEAEVDELAIIRTKGAPKGKKFKVEGTQEQIASAINRIGGGIDFKPGANIRKFETGGVIGQSLQAPVFKAVSSAVMNTQDNSELLDKFDELIESNNENKAAIADWQRELKVTQVTRTVTSAQNKQVRQNNVGTL